MDLTKRIKFMDELNRIYTCSQKDLIDLAMDTVKTGKNFDDVFQTEFDMQSNTTFEMLTEVFKRQVSQTIQDKCKNYNNIFYNDNEFLN